MKTRQIKFRAWNKDLKNMTYTEDYNSLHDRKKWIWTQFTGLHDKNSKEIYEGDFVSVGESFPAYQVVWNFCKCNFMIKNEDGMMDMYAQDLKIMEVIGNIYENPELLKTHGGD